MPEIQQEILQNLTLEQRQMLPRLREAAVSADGINAETRTVTLSFASEEPCPDFWGDIEILRCNETAADISRFANGVMPVLYNHNRNEVIGKPNRIWFENGKAYAEIQFDEDEESTRIWNKVQSGSLRGVSVGYRVKEYRLVKKGEMSADGIQGPAYIAERWEVYEISIVSMPADSTVGVGRSLNIDEVLKFLNKSGGKNMDEKTLQNPQNEEQQQKQAPVVVTPPTASAVDVEAERAAAQKAERERCAEINTICRQFNIDDEMAQRFISDGLTVDKVRAAVLDELGKRNQPTSVAGGLEVTADEQDKKRALYRDGFLMRAGVAVSKPVEGSERYRFMSMENIARDMLMNQGERNVMAMSQDDLFKRTITTGLLPALLSEVTEVSLREGYQAADATYQQWAYIGSVPDFRERKTVRIGLGEEPVKIPENGEFTAATLKEAEQGVKINTYGRSYAYTREAFINDDKDVIVRIPYMLGRKYPLLINRLAYQALAGGTYTANANKGTTGAISTDTIAEAMALLRTTKDPLSGEYLRIRPRYLVVPVALEATAAQLLRSTADPSANNSGVANIYQGALTLISDPELDAIDPDAWYLLGEPVGGEGVEVDFLNGNKTPFIEGKESFKTLGWEYRSYFDFGVKLMSTLGYVKNDGN